ncbi:hypothetical protein HPP92_025067 [Vanilla planifolia]|uniref:ABC transporter domain-containing protein n=1 Tax=Vanilla planifolia TaxID=51239 RepID=A0A835PJD9_VANPL|nr:hypothetical protein HPP92_025067 [Vanilla planifolia]
MASQSRTFLLASCENSLEIDVRRENGRPFEMDGDVCLAWEDLWVFSSKGGGLGNQRLAVLSQLTGVALPAQLLAIMGPSGCAKTTLLDTLAGRLPSNLSYRGELLVNGRKQSLASRTLSAMQANVMQDDVLMTTLTVREAVHYAAELQLQTKMGKADRRSRVEETLRQMGLSRVAEKTIGGGSASASRSSPSRSADGGEERMTVIAAVHQPTTEVFALFHSVCFLAYGRMAFFGTPAVAEEFFAMNGFPCPPQTNPSEHYLRTINKDFETDMEEDMESGEISTAAAIEILVNSYKSSRSMEHLHQIIAYIREMEGKQGKTARKAGILMQTLLLTERSFVNMYRDVGYYWLRFAIYIALCLCVGTIYHKVSPNYISNKFVLLQAKNSMLMFTTVFLTFMAIGGFPSFMEEMKVFTRERLNGHYGVSSFVIASTLSSSPYLALISTLPGAIAYYLVGLQPGIDHFAYFALVLFACMMLVESLMMIVAGLVPDFLLGIITGAGIQGIMMLNGGLFRLPNDLPLPLWKYPLYYISFHKYAVQGFYKNEFMGQSLEEVQTMGGMPTIVSGEEILRRVFQVEMGYSKWVDLGILLGMVLFYRILLVLLLSAWENVRQMGRRRSGNAHTLSYAVSDVVD